MQRYHKVKNDFASHPIARNALLRCSRLLGRSEQWDELTDVATELLKRKDLAAMDRIEGYGALALAHVQRGRLKEAAAAIMRANAAIEKAGLGQTLKPPVQFAQVAFAEGELLRLESEKIKLVVAGADGSLRPAPNFVATLEKRCQGLLDAQAAFTEAMRARDSHWSAMSGFRVGQLYQQLHREAMAIPPPPSARTQRQEDLFRAAMQLRYRVVLKKGLRMMKATVALGERTGKASSWIARAREAKRNLEAALAAEKAAMKKLPYSEEEVRMALEQLSRKAKAKADKNGEKKR